MDVGSAIVAGLFATLLESLYVTLLRRLGRARLDLIGLFGRRAAREPQAAFAAGVVLLLAAGTLNALLFAAVWGAVWTTWGPEMWPIAPLQGASMALVEWVALLAVPAVRANRYALLGGLAVYGATLGLVYSPGI